jgi:uncharacterized protein
MKKLTLIFSFCLVAIFAQAQQATEATVRELLAATGSANMGKQMMDNLFAQFRKDIKDSKANSFFEGMAAEINTNTLIEMIVPVYQKNYTEQELRAAIDFYKTPNGKKMLEKTPLVMQESMEIGQKWGREIAEKVMDRMEKEGLKKGRDEPNGAELEQMRMDSIAVAAAEAKGMVITDNPAMQKAEDDYNKEIEKATALFTKKIEDAEKKRQKAIDKAVKTVK